MAQQLRTVYQQLPGFVDIEVFSFDDFHLDVVFDIDVSSFVFEGGVVSYQGVVAPLFTITNTVASGISIDLTDAMLETVPNNATYFVRGTHSGDTSRTYLAGRFTVVDRKE